jgi:hypothetical protein
MAKIKAERGWTRLDLEHGLKSLALGLDSSGLEHSSWRHCVLAECETDLDASAHVHLTRSSKESRRTYPVVPVAQTLLLDSLDISLFLEDLGVLCHIFSRFETVKVPYVRLAI